MSPETYSGYRAKIVEMGYGPDIEWSETVGPPRDAVAFALEIAFVICNSGMKATIARPIYDRVRQALLDGRAASTAFGHPGKSAAIDLIWSGREELLADYLAAEDKIAWLAELPWIGPITKYHCARNFGLDFVKPDRHLERIAEAEGTTPADLCAVLAEASGDRVGTVDYVLWRAAERGLIKTMKLAQGQGVLW